MFAAKQIVLGCIRHPVHCIQHRLIGKAGLLGLHAHWAQYFGRVYLPALVGLPLELSVVLLPLPSPVHQVEDRGGLLIQRLIGIGAVTQ